MSIHQTIPHLRRRKVSAKGPRCNQKRPSRIPSNNQHPRGHPSRPLRRRLNRKSIPNRLLQARPSRHASQQRRCVPCPITLSPLLITTGTSLDFDVIQGKTTMRSAWNKTNLGHQRNRHPHHDAHLHSATNIIPLPTPSIHNVRHRLTRRNNESQRPIRSQRRSKGRLA